MNGQHSEPGPSAGNILIGVLIVLILAAACGGAGLALGVMIGLT